jgi:hypothetical protein
MASVRSVTGVRRRELDRGLVDADRGFDAGEEHVLGLVLFQECLEFLGIEGGEGVLAKTVGLAPEGEELGLGRAELGGDLLGERERHAESAGGGDGQRGAAHEGVGAGRGGEEGLLQVDDEQEGAGERRFVGHGLLQ